MARDWDAVHLTTLAYLETAGRVLAVPGDGAAAGAAGEPITLLGGWNPGATLWLTDEVRVAGEPSQRWAHRDRDDGYRAWTRVPD